MKNLFIYCVWVFVCFLSNSVNAGSVKYEMSQDDAGCIGVVAISGEIKEGDASDFRSLVSRAKQKQCGNRFSLVKLNSHGGNIRESLKIGRIIRENELTTAIDPRDTCLSACVFIFGAGVLRLGSPKDIGIHRPYFSELNPNVSAKDIKRIMDTLNSEIYEYLREMEISPILLEDMMAIEPISVKYLTYEDIYKYRLDLRPPSYEEKSIADSAYKYGLSSLDYRIMQEKSNKICNKKYPELIYATEDEQLELLFACQDGVILGINEIEAAKRRRQAKQCHKHYSDKISIRNCVRRSYLKER